MKRIKARHLLNYTTNDLWNILVGDFILVFDDNVEILTNFRKTLYSSYFWEFHRQYPDTPILHKHHVDYILGDKYLGSNTHMALLTEIYKTTVETYKLTTPLDRDRLTKLVYEVANYAYNDLIKRTERFVVSIDILDFIDVIDSKEIEELLVNVKPTEQSINNVYASILKVIGKDSNLDNNALALASRSRLVSNNQLLQCISPRGYVTDIDSMIFQVPVLRGYVQGLRSLYDSMIESRSAAKSLFFSEDPLKEAEYFSRRLQLLTMTVENIHYGDCGSQNYLTWYVKPPLANSKGVVFKGDLPNLVGKYYLDEITNTLKCITKEDKHLSGTTIKIRSVVAGCNHPDVHGVCSTCFGKLADNITPNADLGHLTTVTLTKPQSQLVLSTKHYDGSSIVDEIVLEEAGTQFFKVSKAGNEYLINPLLKGKALILKVSPEDAFALGDIALVDDVHEINVSRISNINFVGFELTENGVTSKTQLCVSFNNRAAMFTHDFLNYIKVTGWTVDDNGNYKFDISDWDVLLPIMELPNRQYNMSDHSNNVASIIEARVNDLTERSKPETPAATLVELFDTVNSKMDINLSVLDVIVYASMVINPLEDKYSLPKEGTTRALGVSALTIASRSLGGAYAYENLFDTMTKPRSYFKLDRLNHPMDTYFAPYEVVEDYKNRPYEST
jgi:hypothetical protein